MIFGIACDGDATAILPNNVALRDCVHGVIGSLGLNIWPDSANNWLNGVGVKQNNPVHATKSSYQFSAFALGHHRAFGALRPPNGGVGIYSDHQAVAEFPGTLEITKVSNVQ
jgi:hypothetical protein